MKKIFLVIVGATVLFSCAKEKVSDTAKVDSVKIIDSINQVRMKINDSIRKKRTEDRFEDKTGTYTMTHNMIPGEGKVTFEKFGRDKYYVKGSLQNAQNYLKIDGKAVIVDERNFNFQGLIEQSISDYDGGKAYVRSGIKTFSAEKSNKTFRLQDKVNGSGFVDYIDIKF